MDSVELYKRIEKDIVLDVDGFYYFWPSGTGHFSEHTLRLIADILTDANKLQDEAINRFHEHN